MTDVVSVSASTAAYAAEPVKPAQRVTGHARMIEAAIEDWAAEAAQTDDPRQKSILNIVKPPALAVLFLTAPGTRSLSETARQQVEAAYLETMGETGAAKAAREADKTAQTEATKSRDSDIIAESDTPVSPYGLSRQSA